MKEIKLECGSIIKVDDEDYEYPINFYDMKVNNHGYVYCSPKNKYKSKKMGLFSMTLHKILMNPEKKGRNTVVDHRDGNKLNNQKENLRVCTHKENMANRKLQGGTSEYKGVYWHKSSKWFVNIGVDGKRVLLGTFDFENEIAAANCYNYWAIHYYGEYALLNDVPYMTKEEWMAHKRNKEKTSKYIGVSLNKSTGMYKVQIWNGKKNIQLGEFETEDEAALEYNKKAIELKGSKAKLNNIEN